MSPPLAPGSPSRRRAPRSKQPRLFRAERAWRARSTRSRDRRSSARTAPRRRRSGSSAIARRTTSSGSACTRRGQFRGSPTSARTARRSRAAFTTARHANVSSAPRLRIPRLPRTMPTNASWTASAPSCSSPVIADGNAEEDGISLPVDHFDLLQQLVPALVAHSLTTATGIVFFSSTDRLGTPGARLGPRPGPPDPPRWAEIKKANDPAETASAAASSRWSRPVWTQARTSNLRADDSSRGH